MFNDEKRANGVGCDMIYLTLFTADQQELPGSRVAASCNERILQGASFIGAAQL
jgi:hypothetical protein